MPQTLKEMGFVLGTVNCFQTDAAASGVIE
jgi:hypothetical protein